MSTSQRYEFAFAPSYRVPALLLGITPRTAWVRLDDSGLALRFGAWRMRTAWDNVVDVAMTGNFAWWKTAGPPHLSFADRGVTFATNGDAGVCVSFREPVPAIDPTRVLKHPGATITVSRPDQFADEVRLRSRLGTS